MANLKIDRRIRALAGQLGLRPKGDAVGSIRDFALSKVARMFSDFQVRSLEGFRSLVAGCLSMNIAFVRVNDDIARIAEEFGSYHANLFGLLRTEFIEGTTEGLVLQNPNPLPGERRYLAVIDARGDREWRAYFTAWHELTHLLILPAQQLSFQFRRTPAAQLVDKDPVESLVDHIAGLLAYYEPIFRPALRAAVKKIGRFDFEAIDSARQSVAPDASFFSAAVAALRYVEEPVVLVSVGLGYKNSELRKIRGPNLRLPGILDDLSPTPKLRVLNAVPGGKAGENQIGIFRNMRVPERSVLSKVFTGGLDSCTMEAEEDQSWWETSSDGSLPPLPLLVTATRRGNHVYGLIFHT